MSNVPSPAHDQSITIARGLGICFVLLGHLPSSPELFPFVPYSFHMPLFFFLSGLVARENTLRISGNYLKRIALRLLLPFYFYYILLAIFGIIFTYISGKAFIYPNWLDATVIFRDIWINNYSVPLFFMGWFLTSLFIVSLAAPLVYATDIKIGNRKWPMACILAAAATASMAFGQTNLETSWYETVNLLICRNIIALFFFWIGFISKKIVKSRQLGNVSLLLICIFAQYFVARYANGNIAFFMQQNRYSSLIIPFLTSFLGIIFILSLSALFENATSKRAWVMKLGENSLPIFALHTTVFHVINFLARAVAGAPPPDGIWDFYRTSTLWPIYVAAALLLPTLLAEGWKSRSFLRFSAGR